MARFKKKAQAQAQAQASSAGNAATSGTDRVEDGERGDAAVELDGSTGDATMETEDSQVVETAEVAAGDTVPERSDEAEGISDRSIAVPEQDEQETTIQPRDIDADAATPDADDADADADDDDEEDDSEDPTTRISRLEADLETTRSEKDHLATQYRTLLSKLTTMRQSLGDRLREDAEELDRREVQIAQLAGEVAQAEREREVVKRELKSSVDECAQLSAQISQLRQADSVQSGEILALTRDMRELRAELEMVRSERDEWSAEASRERERREVADEQVRVAERQRREDEARRRWAEEECERERTRAGNLQDVLAEFQGAKDLEVRLATEELERELKGAVEALGEWKRRAADAEVKMTNISSDVSRTSLLEQEIKEKNAQIGRLRHEAVLTQEHLTEALRRLRRNTSDVNVDRRLVTNVLLQYIVTPRADPKRYEMLSLLATILSWEDSERERAGLQRAGGGTTTPGKKGSARRKESDAAQALGVIRTQEEQDNFNESFSDLFVEFLLKEAAQGQKKSPTKTHHALPSPSAGGRASPPIGNSSTGGFRQRTYSNSSLTSNVSGSFPSRPNFTSTSSQQYPHHSSQSSRDGNMNLNLNLGSGTRSPQYMSSLGQKIGYGAQASSSEGGEARHGREAVISPRSTGGMFWQSGNGQT